jgi:hypothetical protein
MVKSLRNPESLGMNGPPDTTIDWEAELQKEGMPSELPEDEGAKALRESMREESEDTLDTEIRREIVFYFATGNQFHGDHNIARSEIAAKLGIPHASIPESIMESVRDEIKEAVNDAREFVKNSHLRGRRLEAEATEMLKNMLGEGIDYDTLGIIYDRYVLTGGLTDLAA